MLLCITVGLTFFMGVCLLRNVAILRKGVYHVVTVFIRDDDTS